MQTVSNTENVYAYTDNDLKDYTMKGRTGRALLPRQVFYHDTIYNTGIGT